MIAPLLLLLAAQLALVPQVQAQASSTDVGSFFVPPNSQGSVTTFDNIPVWTIGEQKTIEYTTVYETYTIALYQENLDGQSAAPGPNAYSRDSSDSTSTSFSWIANTYSFDLSDSPVFFFWIFPGPDETSDESITSSFFNLTQAASSTSSTASSTATSTTSSTSTRISTHSTSSATQSQTSTPSPNNSSSSSSSGLSTGAKVGIGIGVAVAALTVLGAAVFFLCCRGRRNASRNPAELGDRGAQDPQKTNEVQQAGAPYYHQQGYQYPDGQHQYAAEMGQGRYVPVEMDSTRSPPSELQ